MPVTAICNPVAGRARGAKLRALALAELNRLFPDLRVEETAAAGHATELSRRAAGSELVIAIGGDGTLREVASGLAGTGTPVAVVPVGSGNDFIKTIGISPDVARACVVARSGTDRKIDLARLTPAAGAGSVSSGGSQTLIPNSLVFANAAGFGFDAAVVSEARSLKRLSGLPLYLTAVLRAIRCYECPPVHISLDESADSSRLTVGSPEAVGGERSAVSWDQRILLLACANGRYYGGGMKIAPEAEPDDGLLEICVIEAVGRLKILRYLPRFVAGTHTDLGEVRMLRTQRLNLEFSEPVLLQLDGDLQPEPVSGRFLVEVLPQALTIRS